MGSDGARVWDRPVTSFYGEWGKDPLQDPSVLTGYDAFDPFVQRSPRVYAAGDLTGSSSEYVVVAHSFRYIENGFKFGSFVTAIDAATGRSAWMRFYRGVVTQLLIDDGVLVVGHETGDPSRAPGNNGAGEVGTTSTLTGFTFSPAGDGRLVAEEAWSHSTATEWARWLALEPTRPGTIVAAWSATRPGAGTGEYGHVVLIDSTTGEPTWDITTGSYPRILRYDGDRDEIVVAGQSDPSVASSYTLDALRRSDGSNARPTITRPGAVPFALEVGDVDGQPGAEWVTTDLTVTSSTPGSTVRRADVTAIDVDGTELWQVPANATSPEAGPGWNVEPHPYGLSLQHDGDSRVVLVGTYFDGTEPQPLQRRYSGQSHLRALSGASGAEMWSRTGDVLTPLALAPYLVDGRPGVLTSTGKLVVNVYSLADGSTLQRTPLLADVTALEATDVNGDEVTDLVVGGQSEAVFALDGRTLGPDPSVLWTTPVAGEVHEIHAVSLPDGGKHLVVVAATASVVDGNTAYPIPTSSGVEVLAASTGERRFTIPTLPDYAWTAVVAQLTPDGVPAIIVPTTSLTAYRASDGAELWSFDPAPVQAPSPALRQVYFSNPVVTDDGKVAAQYFVNVGVNAASQRLRPTSGNSNHQVRVLLDGATGDPLWQVPLASPGLIHLWRAVAPATTAEGTPGVAFSHNVGQHPSQRTQVDVHDVSDGSLSHSALLARGSQRGLVSLPVTGLISFNVFNEIASIAPQGAIERRMGWPMGEDVAQAETRRYGDVLVTVGEGHGWVGIFDAEPVGATYTRRADWVGGVTGGRLLINDLDRDGSDEIVHYSFDNDAYVAVTNQYGLFSVGGDGGSGSSGIDIYSYGCPPNEPDCSVEPPIEDTILSFTARNASSGQFTDDATFEARLTTSDGSPLAGATVTFALAGEGTTAEFATSTSEDGIATVTRPLLEKPATYELSVRFGGNDQHMPATTDTDFVVAKEDSLTALNVVGKGSDSRLEARLSDLDSPHGGIAGRQIDFYSDGDPIGSARTNEEGVATITIPPGHRGAKRTYDAVFPGDGFFIESSDRTDRDR